MMGLVDYDSDSDSAPDVEAPAAAASKAKPAPTTTASDGAPGPKKKPFRKLIDRSDPKKIRVELPGSAAQAGPVLGDEPPAKRARTGGGGAFGGFNSMLPAPKNVGRAKMGLGGGATTRPVGLKTGSERGFVRDGDGVGGAGGGGGDGGKGPEIPEGMKREEDVKLVGKPLMFRPLSVSRNSATAAAKKKKKLQQQKSVTTTAAAAPTAQTADQPHPANGVQEGPSALKPQEEDLDLFSLPSLAQDPSPPPDPSPTYAPFAPFPAPDPSMQQGTGEAAPATAAAADEQQTVSSLAQGLNLSATAHRDLFGRAPAPEAGFLTFDLSREYSRNEALRQSGELVQPQRPVRAAVQGGGKHSLRQLVNAVAGQKEALEEGFERGREKRREAGGRYGWR